MEYYTKSVKSTGYGKTHLSLAYAYEGIAKISLRKGSREEASKYYNRALHEVRGTNDELGIAVINNGFGEFLYQGRNIAVALEYFKKGLKYAQKAGSVLEARNAYKGLATIYEELGDYKNALECFKLYKHMTDSVLNTENTKNITREITRLQYEEEIKELEQEQKDREAELEREKQEKVIMRNTFIIAFSFLFILAAFIFFSLQRKRKHNKLLERLNSEILKQKDELKKTNEKLVELDEFKQGMTGMIVHDLKNPLNAILNPSASLPLEGQLKMAKQYGKQMLNMILNILDLQKYQDTKMVLDLSACSIVKLINKAIEEVQFLCESKNISVKNNVFSDFGIMADSEILNRVFINLLTNAVKFSPSKGEIITRVEKLPDTGMLKIFVSDEGAGIPDDKLDEVFDKFAQVQVKESGTVKSTGLGLTFCKIAVHAHGGEIGVESDQGKGSTFWFTLCPANSEETVTAEIKPVSAEKNLPRLTEKEKEGILAYLNQLRETKIYYISRLRKILSEVDAAGDENIKHWKDSVENAIYLENKEEFKMLVE